MLTIDNDDSSSSSDGGQLQDESKLEVYDDNDDVLPFWKRIFHLPFEPVWAYTVLLLGIFSIYRSIYRMCFAVYTKELEDGYELSLIVAVFFLTDVLLMIGGKKIRNLHLPPTVMILPNWIILCDSLSICPIELLVSIANITPADTILYYGFQLNNCLKIARVYYVFYYQRTIVGNSKLLPQFFEILFNFGMTITLGYVIIYETICLNAAPEKCSIPVDWKEYIEVMYVTISLVTGTGTISIQYKLFGIFLYSILSLLYFFTVACVSMCYITIGLFSKYKNSYIFRAKVNLMNEAVEKLNIPYDLVSRSQKYYSALFKKRQGNLDNLKDFIDLPPTICEQIGIDFCLSTFKHSAIFRQCDLPFLRYLSYFIESKIMLPGDTVYEHLALKSELVYVASGVIQILTEEDGVTPILSFSSGTCLGELSLFVSYKSRVKVCCKTHCNLFVLSKRNFMQAILKVYPKRYRELRQIIFKRISDTRKFCEISQHFNSADQLNNNTDLITIMWLKSTLHRLMIKDGETLSKHECQNIFLRSEFDKNRFKNKFFIPDYLDTLVISERVELVTDTVFLRSTCPCVFQPHSIVLQTWNYIILALAIVTAVVVPFYAFLNENSSIVYVAFIWTITLFWWLDLYVQISTAVTTSYETISNINEIFYYRITTSGFITDIICAIPFDLFTCVLLFRYTDRYVAFLHLNRILKVYRIDRVFQNLESSSNAIIAKNYLKFVCYFTYFIYIYTCILYTVKCFISTCPPQADFDDFLWHALVVVQSMTATNMRSKYSNAKAYFLVYIILAFFSTFLYIISNAFISAIHILRRLSKIFLLDTITDIFSIIEYNKLTLKYKNRIMNYIETQWNDNKANKLLFNTSAFHELPSDLYMYMKELTYRTTLSGMPLFSSFPDEVIAEVSVIARGYILPPNQVLYYKGEIPDDIYIIDRGYCKAIPNLPNQKPKYLGPTEGIAVMEAFLRLPIINTIITVTHCRSLRINIPELMLLLLKYPNCKAHLDNTVQETKEIDSILFREITTFTNSAIIDEYQTEESFRRFDYNPKLGSSDQLEYDRPFEQLRYLYFVKIFLMRTTILPNGKFLFYWECIRCVCAFLSAILFSDNEISMCINCVWFVVLIILDIMAWVDIYLRLHVAYYNESSCLVSHPLKTAVYYLTHSFIVDLCAVFPVGLISFHIVSEKNYQLQFILQMNRTLQMHRFVAFFRHLEATKMNNAKIFFVVVEYLPILIVACLLSGGVFRGVLCKLSSDIVTDNTNLTDGIKCATDSWVHDNLFTKPLAPNQIRWYSILIATIIFTQAGIPGFTIRNSTMVMIIIPTTIFAYILSTHIIGKTVAQFTSADSTRLTYQDSLKSINRFLNEYQIQPDLANQLIRHFELKWSRKKGKNIHELLKHFHLALKQDILYDIYGVLLENISVFTTETTAFFRNILLEVNHDVALKNTFICTINDINTKIYIVFKGQVDVIAADKTVISSIGPGSMFGTLDDCKIARQTVGIRASVHTDILIIQNDTFHSILKLYPNIQQQFRSLIAFHVDFLKGRGRSNNEQEVPNFKNNFNFFKNPIVYLKTVVYNPASNFIQIWKMFILLVVCTLEVHFTLYQIAMQEFSLGFVIFQYTCDVFYLINFFISLHTAYENKVGVIIANLDMIRKNFRKNKVKYYLQVISIIPLDIFVWLLPDAWFYMLHPVLRCNRLLRFFYIIAYFHEQQEKINCKLYVRYLYIILLTTLLLQIGNCTLIKIGCIYVPNMNIPIKCNYYSLSSFEKLKVFLTYYNVISMIYSMSYQTEAFPDSAHFVIYFIYLMILLHLVRIVLTAEIYQIVQMSCTQLNKFNLYINRVKHFLEYQRVSLNIINKTCKSLVLLWQYHRGTAFPELLDEAPKLLQEQILNSAFAYHIDQHFVFKNCHIDFNRQLVSYLRNSTYFIHDYIVLQGCIDQCMYFIHSGVVLVLSVDDTNRETIVATLKNGSSFGVLQGLSKRKPHLYSYRSTTTTVILTLKYSTWVHLLKFFPASQEMINESKINYTDINFPTAV